MKKIIFSILALFIISACAHQPENRKAVNDPPATSDVSGARVIASQVDRSQYTVWLNFFSMSRNNSKDFGTRLQGLWSKTPGAQFGGDRTPLATGFREVRCNPSDRAAADLLTQDINSISDIRMREPKEMDTIPRGTLEVYIDVVRAKIIPVNNDPDLCLKYVDPADTQACINVKEQVRALRGKFNSDLTKICLREPRQAVCNEVIQQRD